jgi:hypothetical protein
MYALLRTLILFMALGAAPAQVLAQDGISQKQQEKILSKKAKEDAKAKKKKEKTDRKRHLSIQDKATRKRLKKHTKRADRRGSGAHRDGWLRGLFQRSR